MDFSIDDILKPYKDECNNTLPNELAGLLGELTPEELAKTLEILAPVFDEDWQDYIASRIMNVLALQIPNCHQMSVVNNEQSFIDKLLTFGLITSNQLGSVQNSNVFNFTERLTKDAEKRGKSPLDIVAQGLNTSIYKGDAHFYDSAVHNLLNPSEASIFDFSNKNAEATILAMQEHAEDTIWQILNTRSKHQYVIWKNAIIASDYKPQFLMPDYNNLVIIDTTHCDDEYLANWKYLDINEYLPAFEVIASNQDPETYSEATITHLIETIQSVLIPKSLEVLT